MERNLRERITLAGRNRDLFSFLLTCSLCEEQDCNVLAFSLFIIGTERNEYVLLCRIILHDKLLIKQTDTTLSPPIFGSYGINLKYCEVNMLFLSDFSINSNE